MLGRQELKSQNPRKINNERAKLELIIQPAGHNNEYTNSRSDLYKKEVTKVPVQVLGTSKWP
jgi:hypothetical protein